MHARIREAISACTRTLASASDTDLALALSDAVTAGPLRAAADRIALRRRFVDETIERDHRPHDRDAAMLFEALSAARVDALGARWLAGIRHNLTAFPGRDDDGVRWLAFELLTGTPAPPEKSGAVARARSALSPALTDGLRTLANCIDDHARFAEASAAWSVRAVGHAPQPAAAVRDNAFSIPDRPGGVDVRQGRYALPGKTKPRSAQQSPDTGAQSRAARAVTESVEALTGYRVYTTAYDRVVNAATLVTRDELATLRLQLDADFSPMRSMVARLSKRLMRVLMARQAREWRFDLEDGWIDQSRLPVFVASNGATRPFKQEFESPFPSTVVTLLIDHSGSMKGRPMRIAALTVEMFARILERCGVKCEVLGFTTREWDGGEPGRAWAANGYPANPGRLNALEHVVIKPADTPWRRARVGLGLFLRDDMLKENIDGEALAWAHQRLLARPERRRILIVISDGTPMDEATAAANGFDYLDGHLAAVVQQIERQSPVKLAAIGIGLDVSQFYSNATRISKIDDLGPALTDRLSALLAD